MLIGWTLHFLTYDSFLTFLFAITLPCDEKYQAENGSLCYPCGEGFYKVSDCVVNGEQARCRPCRNGEYQPFCDNSTKCDHCRLFCNDQRKVKVKNCSATSDIECQCKAGFYWTPGTGKHDEGYCASHSKCTAGEGLVEKGTPFKNTKCKPCEEGVTYSSNASFDACVPCSECNSTVAFKCTTTSDVDCGALPDKPSPTESSSKDGGKCMVFVIVCLVLVALAVVVGASVFLYRRRRNTETNSPNGGSEVTRVDISNWNTHGSLQGQNEEVSSSQTGTGVHYFPNQSACDLGSTAASSRKDHTSDARNISQQRNGGIADNSESDSRTSLSNSQQSLGHNHENSEYDAQQIRQTKTSTALDPQHANFNMHINSPDSEDNSYCSVIDTGRAHTVSSQNRCTSSETSENGLRSDYSNKSTGLLQEIHNTQNGDTDNDQNTIDDINKKSKDCTFSATPENDIRNNYSDKRAEMLQERLDTRETAMDTKKGTQDIEKHRSKLSHGSATPDTSESNANGIYNRQFTAVTDVNNSKLNGAVQCENISDMSMDAVGVSARHGVQQVSLSEYTSGEERSETNEADFTTGTNDCSEVVEAEVETKPDRSCGPATTETGAIKPTSSSSIEKVWFESMDFLAHQMSFKDFKKFIRRLTANTNPKFHETIDVKIENSVESNTSCSEKMYQLMRTWRQATPEASLMDVFAALRQSELNVVCNRLIGSLKSKNLLDSGLEEQCIDASRNEIETKALPRGELPMPNTILRTENDVMEEECDTNSRNVNHEMMELKPL
ncbi:uncharacterized protein LOC128558572 [Mercenaria mercenaria]|uniref:uncharacterized protein LOC128558572 n=1 Tax=Mercenaria mercenaria TaxID=6596 RepID=UPI00234EC4D2|nr:uncharacterized protein LOC128558572 [Mercenaria mercenaria]